MSKSPQPPPGNWLDRTIYSLFPSWGARRMATRAAYTAHEKVLTRITSRYEGGRDDEQRADQWMKSNLSPDTELDYDLPTLRQKSRELCKNDFVGGAIDSRAEHVVGSGFTPQAKIREKAGVVTAARAKALNKQFEELFTDWAEKACATRKRSLWQKLGLINRCIDTDGEFFVVFSSTTSQADALSIDPVSPIPLAIEIIDPERVETPPTRVSDGNCRLGIQYAENGEILGYWIRESVPGDKFKPSEKHVFVKAENVAHGLVEWFCGQSRGLPWMTRILNRVKDGKTIVEAGILGAEVEACHAAFVKTGASSPINHALRTATSTTTTGKRLETIDPGRVEYLNHDQDVVFSAPQRTNIVGTLIDYINRTVSAGLNYAYEFLMKDWRGVSFAGGRLILHGVKITIRSRQQLIIEVFLRLLWQKVCLQGVLFGKIDMTRDEFTTNQRHFTRHNWTPPKWGYALTPGEEVNAKVTAIDNNLTTLEEELAEDQYDLEEVLEQRRIERALEREYEITPTKVTQVEQPRGINTPLGDQAA